MTSLSFPMPSARNLSKLWLWIGGMALTAGLLYLQINGYGTLLTTAAVLVLLFGVLIYDRTTALLMTLGYLFLLGDIRRIRDVAFPRPALDPLLLAGPIVALLLGLPLILKAKAHDPLSKAMLYLTMIMFLEIFNPAQGGLGVGVGGAFFYLVPVLWFWIGRQYGSVAVLQATLYKVLLPLAVAAALMGLYQNFVGFLPYQQLWIEANKSTFVIINMGTGTRSFGFSIAPSEYMAILQIGAIGSFAAFLAGKRVWILPIPLLLTALVLASGRGVIVKMVFALAFTWVVRNSKNFGAVAIIRLVFILILGFAAVSTIASRFAGSSEGTGAQSANSAAIAHQAQGLSDPFNSKKSTAGIHSQYILMGFLEGLRYPLGHGLGSTTAASGKLGSSTVIFTELDLSDLFIALGLPGGLLYLYIVFQAMRSSLFFVRSAPKIVSLPTLAILTGGIGIWMVTSQYSTSAMYLFIVGCLTHSQLHAPKVVPRYVSPPNLALRAT